MKVFKIKVKISWINTSGEDIKGVPILAVKSSTGGFQTSEGWFREDHAEIVETIDLTAQAYEKNHLKKTIEKLEGELKIQKDLVALGEEDIKELRKQLEDEREFKSAGGPIMIPPTIERDSIQTLLGSGVKKVYLEFE